MADHPDITASETDRLAAVEAKLDQLLERVGGADRRWLGVSDAAAYSGLSAESIRRLLAAGRLTAHRPVPGRVVIDRRELDALIIGSAGRLLNGRGRYRRMRVEG